MVAPAPDPQLRPTRLPVWGQVLIASLLLASFSSGVAIWLGQEQQAETLVTPSWLRATIQLHGSLNPVQGVLFGILLCHHIRVGWQRRINLLFGFLLEAVFAGLIATGAGLYYAPETWHDRVALTHRWLGLALPVALGCHWAAAHAWIKRLDR